MIRKLPTELRSYLRSGVAVTSVTQCVEELLLNSLDAGASCVAVRVDLDCFKLQVVDNGQGISQDQLHLLGDRYATSKCHKVCDLDDLRYFGYRGEALASLREACSVLEVTSRTAGSTTTYSKLFQQGRALKPVESSIPRPSVGTTITVYDLFRNFPVRRKATNEGLELERIRQRVQGLALLRPTVSISLRNDATGTVLIQTHKTSTSLLTFTQLFGTARARSLVEVKGTIGHFSVEGYIGKEGHSRKELQFVYVNGRLVLKTKIHKLINQTLAKSAIFKRKYCNTDASPVLSKKVSLTGSPTKQADRYPVYVLDIKCPLMEYDITFDPGKTLVEFKDWDTLLKCTTDVVDSFLKRENLLGSPDTSADRTENDATEEAKIDHQSSYGNTYCPISPSNMKDTLVSKKVKRVTNSEPVEETPRTISLEEWKAKHMPRPTARHVAESSGDESMLGDWMTGSDDHAAAGDAVGDHLYPDPQPTSEAEDNAAVATVRNMPAVARDEIRDRARLGLINDPQVQTNYREQLASNTDGSHKVIGKAKSSLSDFKKSIGKFNQQNKVTLDIDTTLKARMSSGMIGRGQSVHSKVTSSLQKFRKITATLLADNTGDIQVTANFDRDRDEDYRDNSTKTLHSHSTGNTEVQDAFENIVCPRNGHQINRACMCRDDNSNITFSEGSRVPRPSMTNSSVSSNAHAGQSKAWSNFAMAKPSCFPVEKLGRHPQFCSSISASEATSEVHFCLSENQPSTSTGFTSGQAIARADACTCNTVHMVSTSGLFTPVANPSELESEQNVLHQQRRKRLSNMDTSRVGTAAKLSKLVIEKASTISINSETVPGHNQYQVKSTTSGDNVLTMELTDGVLSQTNINSCLDTDNLVANPDNHQVSHFPNPVEELSGAELLSINSRTKDNKDSEMHSTASIYLSKSQETNTGSLSTECTIKSPLENTMIIGMSSGNLQLNNDCTPRNHVPSNNELETCNQPAFNIGDMVKNVDNHTASDNNASLDAKLIAVELFKTLKYDQHLEIKECEVLNVLDDASVGCAADLNLEISTQHTGNEYCTQGFTPRVASLAGDGDHRQIGASQGFIPTYCPSPRVIDIILLDHDTASTCSGGFSPHLLDSHPGTGVTGSPVGSLGFSPEAGVKLQESLCTPAISITIRGDGEGRPIADSSEYTDLNCDIICDNDKVCIDESGCLDRHVDAEICSTGQVLSEGNPASSTTTKCNTDCATDGGSPIVHTSSKASCEGATYLAANISAEVIDDNVDIPSMTITQLLKPHSSSEILHTASSLEYTTQNTQDVLHFSDIFSPTQNESEYKNEIVTENQIVTSTVTISEDECLSHKCSGFNNNSSNVGNANSDVQCGEIVDNPQNHAAVTEMSEQNTEPASQFSVWNCSLEKKIIEVTSGQQGETVDIKEKCGQTDNHNTSFDAEEPCAPCASKISANENGFDSTFDSVDLTQCEPDDTEKHQIEHHKTVPCQQSDNGDRDSNVNSRIETQTPESAVKSGVCKDSSGTANEQSGEPVSKWIHMVDPHTGKKMFVHAHLGTTVSGSQWKPSSISSYEQQTDMSTEFRPRPSCPNDLPVGLTPRSSEALRGVVTAHLVEGDTDDRVKWRDNCLPTTANTDEPLTVERMFDDWENPAVDNPDTEVVNAAPSGNTARPALSAYSSAHTCRFTKSMLDTVQVVGQVDNKFIACLLTTKGDKLTAAPDMLAFIDQHAAHERIRLEMLTEEAYKDNDVESGTLAHMDVRPPKTLVLTEEEVRVMESYTDEFRRIGIQFSREPQARDTVGIQTVPVCIVEREGSEARRGRDTIVWRVVQNLIQEHVELLLTTQGACGRLPQAIHRVLCSQACHGAVKFGDSLTLKEAKSLVHDLSRCELPFQCAHGRPAVVPILQLTQLATKLPGQIPSKPKLYKLTAALSNHDQN